MSFKCGICSNIFSRVDALKRHVKNRHPKEYNKFDEKVVCEYCFKKIGRKYMPRHIRRIHQRANLHANKKAYANQQADHASHHVDTRQDAIDPEVPVVDTTVTAVDNTVTAVDTTADVKPLDDCPTIVDQFIRSITGDQSVVANVIVQCLLKETDKEIRYKPYYYIMIGNVWRQAFECNTEKQFPLLDFIDELTGTVRHDFHSQYDFKWMIILFAMGRELIRRMPSFRREVEEMLIYFLCRADEDLKKLGGWDQFTNTCTNYEFPVFTV